MTPSREQLADLRAKYEEILRLREAQEAGEIADPRRELVALASRFPGALREIDELPLAEIRRRLDALTVAQEDAARVAPWMIAITLFHRLTRGALCAKRWLAGRKRVDASTRDAFLREASTLCWGDDARAWADELHLVASPPGGRVTELVFARIASALGVTAREARILVFGLSRRERLATSPGQA